MTAAEPIYREWQVPPNEATESRKIGWLNEAAETGAQWHKDQRGFDDWLKGLDIISGKYNLHQAQEYRSNLTGNRLKVNIQTAISGLASIRPWAGYQSGKEFEKHALMMNLTTRSLYLSNFWDQDIKSALQWASVANTGFLRPVYRRDMAGQGHGSIELDSFGMPSVLPVQMPANGDFQRAYAVTLLDMKPIWEAHGMFSDYQDRLKPTNSRYWYNSQIHKASQANNSRRTWWNPFNKKSQQSGGGDLIPIRYTTINDLQINQTGKTILMGELDSPWSYEVPSVDTEIPAGRNLDGNPVTRKATKVDARMYPFRRLIISSDTCILYDGPAFNWHGRLDLIPFCLDRWPWEPMGFSMVHDAWTIQQALDQIDRGTMDKIVADLDRPLAYNMNAVSKREANQVDLMQPRQRIAFDGDAVDKPFSQIAPDDVYRVSAESLNYRKELQADMDYTLQTRDIVELGKARALGKGMDQLEALINANGPRVKDMSRGMEKSVCELAGQVKFLILQYMDTSRLIPFITESGLNEVFDYDPSTLVPSHLPGEDPHDAQGNPVGSPSTRIQRARWMAQNMVFTLTPHSIHELHQMSYRLMLMQLRQRGYPIAACDVLEANDVPDVRRATGSTTQERFYSEKEEELEELVKIQAVAQGLGIDMNALGGGGGKQPTGRKPSGQAPPSLKTKGDGRPVVSESG